MANSRVTTTTSNRAVNGRNGKHAAAAVYTAAHIDGRALNRLLRGSTASQKAVMAIRIGGYDPDSGICWGGVRHCTCPAHTAQDQTSVYFGRCRSGRRWFWYAFESGERHGWADTEEDALACAMAAVAELGRGRPVLAHLSHGCASRKLKQINKARRAARPAPATSDARAVEYLYGWARAVEYLYGDYRGLDVPGHPVRFRITKKTKKRVFYLRSSEERLDAHGESICHEWDDEWECIGHVDRQKLEGTGEVQNDGVRWWRNDHHLYASFERMMRGRRHEQQHDLQKLKAEMAAAHPDKGGSNAAFIAARGRYEDARRRRRA